MTISLVSVHVDILLIMLASFPGWGSGNEAIIHPADIIVDQCLSTVHKIQWLLRTLLGSCVFFCSCCRVDHEGRKDDDDRRKKRRT